MLSSQILSADNKLHYACDKSFADDLVPSRYCKCESNLCITIHWGFCGVFSICSSVVSIQCANLQGHRRHCAGGALIFLIDFSKGIVGFAPAVPYFFCLVFALLKSDFKFGSCPPGGPILRETSKSGFPKVRKPNPNLPKVKKTKIQRTKHRVFSQKIGPTMCIICGEQG